MMQEFVARGIESGQNWMRISCFFVALISLLCARSVYIMVSAQPERMQEDEKMIYERFYSGRKKGIVFILSVVFFVLFCFGAYKGYSQKEYYQNIAAHDSISKHYTIAKDGNVLILKQKGNDKYLKDRLILPIVSENNDSYHVHYGNSIYVISKKDDNKPPYPLSSAEEEKVLSDSNDKAKTQANNN